MHMFFVLHTLIVAVIAFFVLFAASKADGFVSLLGTILGWIILLLAVLGLAFGIYGMVTGKHGMGHEHWMMKMHDGDADDMMSVQPATPTPATTPTPPNSPAPPTPPKSH